MSTNINGRIARMSIADFYPLLVGTIKPEIEELGKQMLNRALAHLVAEHYDRIALAIGDNAHEWQTARDIASYCYHDMSERQQEVKKTGRRDIEVDHQFEIFLFPQGNQTLMMMNCDQREMIEMFDAHPKIEPYSWWNSTDGPDDLSDQEWAKRESDWMEALPGAGVPRDRCLLFELFDGDIRYHNDTETMWKAMPLPDDRLRKHAENEYVGRHYDQTKGISQVFEILERYRSDPTLATDILEELRPAVIKIEKDTPVQRRRTR